MNNNVKDLTKKIFSLGLVLMLIIWSVIELKAETYCFEDYKWGRTLTDIKNQLKAKNKKANVVKMETFLALAYYDNIFGESCSVLFGFTPKSELLTLVMITWHDITSIGINLKNLLTKKYGNPRQPNQFMEKYEWAKSPYFITLDYSFIKTDLIYKNEDYGDKCRKETAEIIEKEIDRF